MEQAREAGVQISAPQLGELRGPAALLSDHSGLAKHPVVVGHRRLRDAELDRPAEAWLVTAGKGAHDLEPLRVAQRVQNGRQLDLTPIRVVQLRCVIDSHDSIVRRLSNFFGTMFIVLSNRHGGK